MGVSSVVGQVAGGGESLDAMFPAPPRPDVKFREDDERRPVSAKVGGRGRPSCGFVAAMLI